MKIYVWKREWENETICYSISRQYGSGGHESHFENAESRKERYFLKYAMLMYHHRI